MSEEELQQMRDDVRCETTVRAIEDILWRFNEDHEDTVTVYDVIGLVMESLIKEGMSQQEVDALIGQPTAQTQRLTGKQWQPFNFGARDLQRLYYLYKGVGRIEFSMKSGYEGVFRVIKVSPDPAETGYP